MPQYENGGKFKNITGVLWAVWQLAQVLGIVLFAVLCYVCARIYNTVEENGLTLTKVRTVQEGVVKTLDSLDTATRASISRAEHDELAKRVSLVERDFGEIKGKVDILLRSNVGK